MSAVVLVMLVASPAGATSRARPWRVIDLGIEEFAIPHAINDHGHVVGEIYTSGKSRAFFWRNGKMIDLNIEGVESVAFDVNNQDAVVGYRTNERNEWRAFLWQNGRTMDLGVLPGGYGSAATAINDRGVAVGWSSVADNYGAHAFIWRDGAMTDLSNEPYSGARDINDAGQVVGNNGAGACYWWRGQTKQLPSGAFNATANNAFGAITGVHYFSGGHDSGFVWLPWGKYIEIPKPPTTDPGWDFLTPEGINDRMQVVGSSHVGAFVWEHDRMTVLPSDNTDASAFDINERGEIVGLDSSRRAVIWTR